MRDMTGTVEALEHPLLLLSLGVPCWVVTQIFGHHDRYWYRLLERLGRSSLVGTTGRDPTRLPEPLAADEPHINWCGGTGNVAFTTAAGCVLGVVLSDSADGEQLTDAYGQFAAESRAVNPQDAPQTVNTDGWCATRNAFRALCSTIVPGLWFLHGFVKIRDRCRHARELHDHVWEVYCAATAAECCARLATCRAWCQQGPWPKAVLEMVTKLWNRESDSVVSDAHPDCHRTSNLVDRLMNRLTRFLYAGRGLHGPQSSCARRLRGWALLQHFHPFAPRSGQPRKDHSPAHRLNQKPYYVHWLHTLQVCVSLAGGRSPT